MSYFDDYADHIIKTEFYAQEQEEDFREFMEGLKQDILLLLTKYGVVSSRPMLNRLLKEANSLVDEQVDDYVEKFGEERKEQAHEERQFLNDFLKAALGVALLSSLSSLKNILLASFNGKDNLDTFSDTLKTNIKKSFRVPLINSFIMRTGTSTVNDTVAKGIDSIARKSSADVHTMVTAIQHNTQYLSLPGNGKIRLQYVSMLDDRTCSVCASYSGQIYESKEEAPDVPVHDRCRCYLIPIITPLEEPSYGEWLKTQPDSVVYRILGPARYTLWKSGFPVTKFTSEGRKLTLKELYSKK